MFRKLFLGVSLIVVSLLAGCASTGSSTSEPGAPALAESSSTAKEAEALLGAYRLRPLDPLVIQLSGAPDQPAPLELVIDAQGEIRLLHIDKPIKAAGLTASELAHKIEELYRKGGIYKHVTANVQMTAKVYYVQGEVNAPGQYQLVSGTTLLQAIAGARGYTPFANKKKVTITRHGKVYTYNAKELEKHPEKDVKIEAGDVIKVHQQWY